ncbi:MAG: hypothetical protein WC428_05055 [Candidatus Paceibacterota bacterium]
MSTKKFGIVAGIALALSVVVSPAFAACSLTTLSECDNTGLMALVLQLLAGQQTQQTGTGTITGIPAGFTFTTNLKQGSTGNDVKYLQVLLNSDAATSVGNKGSETTYFGAMTKAAVVKFQNKYASEVLTPYGLSAGTGFFGTSSRAKANALIAAGVGTGTGTGTGTVVTGGFTVALAATNPASMQLFQGQAIADLAQYTFSNGTSSPITVTNVTLNRIGYSADSVLANIYLYDGTTRITDDASVSSGVITYNSSAGLFTIPANTSKVITVRANISTAATGTVGISLAALTTNGTLSSALPIAGNISKQIMAGTDLATVAITDVAVSTPTDPMSGVRVWDTTFNVDKRNVEFTSLSLKQISSISSANIGNFQLLIDGVVVSTVASLDANNYVTFTFDKILTTGNKNVKVLADVTGGSSTKIRMSLRNKADAVIKDAEYDVNILATGAAQGTAAEITVGEGQFTIITKNDVLPITVANTASNVLIGKWTFKAVGEAVKVETLTAGFTYGDHDSANAAATLRNGKIMINGSQAGSTATLAQIATGTPYAINYTFQPGVEYTIELYADIYDNNTTQAANLVAGDTIKAGLVVVTGNGTKQTSYASIDIPATGQVSASSVITVGTGEATLTKTSAYTDQSTVLPQTGFKIGSWNLTAGTAEDINVSTLSFAIANVDGANFLVGDMRSMYVTYQIGSSSAVTTSVVTTPTATTTFSSSFTLPKGQTVSINLYANLMDDATPSAIVDGNSVRATLTVTGTGAQSGTGAVINPGETAATAGQKVIAATGSLSVTRDASTPATALITGNNTGVKTVSYKFEALNDSYVVSQLTFTLTGTTALQTVRLKDGSTVLGTASAAPSVTFNFATPISISANSSKVLDLEVDLGLIGAGAGLTGTNVGATLSSGIKRDSASGTAAAIAAVETGNTQYAYKTIPTISLVSLPNTTLTAGTKTLQKFTISADAKSAVAWKQLVFTITKTNGPTIANCIATVPGTTCTGVVLNDGTSDISGTMISSADLTAAGTLTGKIKFIPDSEQLIPASSSKTYELKATTVGGSTTSGHYIMSQLAKPSLTKIDSTSFAKYATGTTLRYVDASTDATGGTVAASDVRQTAVNSYTASGNTATTVRVMTYALTKFDNTANVDGTIDLTYIHAGTTWADAGTGTATGWTVDAASDENSVTLTNASGATIVGTPATALDGNATLTITVTEGTAYAVGTLVATGNSDIGLSFAAGTQAANSTASFVWSDQSASGHSILTTDWATDFLVKNLPTDSQTLSGLGS